MTVAHDCCPECKTNGFWMTRCGGYISRVVRDFVKENHEVASNASRQWSQISSDRYHNRISLEKEAELQGFIQTKMADLFKDWLYGSGMTEDEIEEAKANLELLLNSHPEEVEIRIPVEV